MTASTGPRPRRDALGRPLPHGHPDAVADVPQRDTISGAAALAEALDYLAEGLPFHAHEVLEQRWRCAPDPERPGWKALAQAAAAVTHDARGNRAGARRVWRRALAGLAESGWSDGGAIADEPSRSDLMRILAARLA